MDEIRRIRLMNKERQRKKRAERNLQRENERKQPWRPFSGHNHESDKQEDDKKSSPKESEEHDRKYPLKDGYDKIIDADRKPPSSWLSAKKDSARKQSRSPPTSVISSPSGASIASSLTYSPSSAFKQPQKQSIRPWDWVDLDDSDDVEKSVDNHKKQKRSGLPPRPARKPTIWKYDDSSSDDDNLVRDAKRLAQQQRRAKQAAARKPGNAFMKKRSPKKTQHLEDDSDDDNFIRDAMLLAKKKLLPRSPESRSSQQSSSSNDEEVKEAVRLPRQRKSVDSIQQQSLKSPDKSIISFKKQPSLKSSPAKSIDASQQQSLGSSPDKSIDVQRCVASLDIEEKRSTEPTRQLPAASIESLWSDSENEQVDEKEKDFGKKRKRTKQAPPGGATKKPARSSEGSTSGGRVSKGRRVEGSGSSDEDGNQEDEIDAEELKPHFDNPKLGPPSALLPLVLKCSQGQRMVPAAINRYLKGFQREGVVFMHSLVAENQGAILGDDMGLGKTVQVISLLAALLKKTGSGEDKIQLSRKQNIIQTKLNNNRREQDRALKNGTIAQLSSHIEGLKMSKWVPILIVVPPSVMQNWMNEFQTWGHFGAVAFSGTSRDRALERIRTGLDEIMICGKSVFHQPDDIRDIKQIKWKLIIVDEYHQYKNHKTESYGGLKSLKETCGAPLVGLTGTMMQNHHEELWSEVDLVNPGFLGSLNEFKGDVSVPIKMGRTKSVDDEAIEDSQQAREWLQSKLKSFYLQRKKIDVLKDQLPEKDERVLFCELSPLQKRLYQHFMTLPDYVLLKYANSPCECGVNQAIFQGFRRMRTEAEKVAYQRTNRKDIIKRKRCCHQRPLNHFRFDAGEEMYDPRAPLWRWQHESLIAGEGDEEECRKCPFCISFAALDKLYKLSSHVSLLQVPKHPGEFVEGTPKWKEAQKALDFARVAFPEDVIESLPGGYLREDGIMNDHANLSGKMKVLAELLVEFDRRDDRLLIFSFSTQMLDLIQSFVKAQGYSFLRLDGSTPTRSRQGLVDKYQRDKTIFLFLISTKAGGLGLNLTAANVVIVFDVDFNPSNDEQSQDRAYRIGQKRDVLVIRLVSRGTVEELKYIRQIYKVQLTQDTMGSLQGELDSEAARLFSGVHDDKDRKGELFGMENLLKYKDGSFMEDLWKSSNTNKSLKGMERFGLRSNNDMAEGLDGMTPDQVIEIGGNIENAHFRNVASEESGDTVEHDVKSLSVSDILRGDNARNHEDFLRADRGDALYQPGDEGFDEEMGGQSQAARFVMENADVPMEQGEHDLYAKDTTAPSPVACRSQTNLESGPVVSARPVAFEERCPAAAVPSPVRSAPAARNVEPSPVMSARPVSLDGRCPAAAVPSPVRSVPTARVPARNVEGVSRREEPPVPRLARQNQLHPAINPQSSRPTLPPSRFEQPGVSENVATVARLKKPHQEKTNKPGGGKKGATTFTTKDLFVPRYAKKKKKKKKKSV